MSSLSLEYVKTRRHLPFVKRGMRVEVAGKPGRITGGSNSGNLNVRLDGERFSGNTHPWWETVYFADDGTILADFRGLSGPSLEAYVRTLHEKHCLAKERSQRPGA